MHLVGLDIGFSKRRRSNAIAIFRDGKLIAARTLNVAERDEFVQSLHDVDVVALDAPIIPPDTPEALPRECERAFGRNPFQKRCKPGMSHVPGTGRLLRAHGQRAATQLKERGITAVEAFPNAFLGVVLPDDDFVNRPKIPRGGKFDWLYNRWIAHQLFPRVVTMAGLPIEIALRCETERNHDIRAALICLLTAAFAANRTCAVVGKKTDGFFLPPIQLWASWTYAPVHISETSPC
jgi:predicted nuclease with RNAse H fold